MNFKSFHARIKKKHMALLFFCFQEKYMNESFLIKKNLIWTKKLDQKVIFLFHCEIWKINPLSKLEFVQFFVTLHFCYSLVEFTFLSTKEMTLI